VQYAVLSDDEINILYMSDEVPDAEGRQYVRVPELPTSSAEIIPRRYEGARILAFAGGYFQLNAEDRAILDELNREHRSLAHSPTTGQDHFLCGSKAASNSLRASN
jgi:hypothetical protein